ncbi:MAG: zinc metallopeptidase [Firmicutes bacterium]|nr:zinc metallopeptidase [Bacillota bacterium]MCL2770897.1 zinc metallopeptidase [Bacillota bacterium]
MVYLWIAVGVVLGIGILISFTAGKNFWDTVKQVGKKDKEKNSQGMTAGEFAQRIIAEKRLPVVIGRSSGKFKEFYSPTKKAIAISEEFYTSQSMVAVGVTAHEIGHALDHNKNGKLFNVRLVMARFTRVVGFFFWLCLVTAGILWLLSGTFEPDVMPAVKTLLIVSLSAFGFNFLFRIMNAGVERTASKYAMQMIREKGFSGKEQRRAKKILNAAYLTYIGDIFKPFVQVIKFILAVLNGILNMFVR